MKIEVKQKWLEALRSGRYKQAQAILRDDGPDDYGYCCLGVLCDVVEPDQWGWECGTTDEDGDGDEFLTTAERAHRLACDNAEELSAEALDELGLTMDQQSDLIEMNDQKEFDFIQIADWIEQNIVAEAA